MNFLIKNACSEEEFLRAKNDVEENRDFLEANKRVLADFKSHEIFQLKHHNVVKLKNLIEAILSTKVINEFKNRFRKIYLINFFNITINSYTARLHRDGQSLGFHKKGLEMSKKIFKVVFYFNNYNSNKISLSIFNSKPLELFKNEKIYTKINYYLEHYVKKNFLKDSGYQNCDALVFDSNTWHFANDINTYKLDKNKINKIYCAYEIVVDDYETAKSYAAFLTNKFNIKTNNKIDLKAIHCNRLKMFDDIVDL